MTHASELAGQFLARYERREWRLFYLPMRSLRDGHLEGRFRLFNPAGTNVAFNRGDDDIRQEVQRWLRWGHPDTDTAAVVLALKELLLRRQGSDYHWVLDGDLEQTCWWDGCTFVGNDGTRAAGSSPSWCEELEPAEKAEMLTVMNGAPVPVRSTAADYRRRQPVME